MGGKRHRRGLLESARWCPALATVLLALAATLFVASTVRADPLVDELRLGGLAQNIEASGSEDGASLNAELLFRSPFAGEGEAATGFLKPRPHLGGTASLAGGTSKIYAGLTWEFPITDRIFFEASFGGAVHDGPLDVPDDSTDAAYGCRVNFRESAALGMKLDERWSMMLMIDHMSNAHLCERNRGLTNAGLRLGYSLD